MQSPGLVAPRSGRSTVWSVRVRVGSRPGRFASGSVSATHTLPAVPLVAQEARRLAKLANLPTSTAPVSAAGRPRLDEARAHLAAVSDPLDGWYARKAPGCGPRRPQQIQAHR